MIEKSVRCLAPPAALAAAAAMPRCVPRWPGYVCRLGLQTPRKPLVSAVTKWASLLYKYMSKLLYAIIIVRHLVKVSKAM